MVSFLHLREEKKLMKNSLTKLKNDDLFRNVEF